MQVHSAQGGATNRRVIVTAAALIAVVAVAAVVGVRIARSGSEETRARPGTTPASGSASPESVDPAETSLTSEVVFQGGWGSGPGQFGLFAPADGGVAEGPAAFAVDEARQRIYVVDGLNARLTVLTLDGEFVESRQLGTRTVTAAAVAEDGTVLLVDPGDNKIIEMPADGSAASDIDVDLSSFYVDTSYSLDPAGKTLYATDLAMQTRTPILQDGRVVDAADRRARTESVVIEMTDRELVVEIGRQRHRSRFDIPVGDIRAIAVATDGGLWLLAESTASPDGAYLMRLDASGRTSYTPVGGDVHDVVLQQLAVGPSGVWQQRSGERALELVRYEEA